MKYRTGFVTNSSSSSFIVTYNDEESKADLFQNQTYKQLITKDGKTKYMICKDKNKIEFCRQDWTPISDIETKINFCAIAIERGEYNVGEVYNKKRRQLNAIIKELTGLETDWSLLDEKNEELRNKIYQTCFLFPWIDYPIMNLAQKIVSSRKRMRNFILNPKSTLYIGGDEYSFPYNAEYFLKHAKNDNRCDIEMDYYVESRMEKDNER